MKKKSKWAEIRTDYIDEEDLFWRVDAWETSDDCEEGKVIAYIDDLTLRVLFIDPVARVDEYAVRAIGEKVEQLKREKSCDCETCLFNPDGICLAKCITGKDAVICDDGCDSWEAKTDIYN